MLMAGRARRLAAVYRKDAMMKSKPFLVAAIFLLPSCSVETNSMPSDTTYRAKLTAAELMTADPVEDLHAALRRGDTRFIGILDIAEDVPGAEQRPDAVTKYGVRYVQGTSDTTPYNIGMNAYDYAEIYNRLLIRHLKATNGIAPFGPPPTPLIPNTKPS